MKSIRRHLTVRLSLLAVLLLPCGVLSVYFVARHLLVSQFDATMAAKADALMSAAEVDGDDFDIDLDVQSFAGFGSALTGDFFEVRHSDGRVIARSPSLENQNDPFSSVPLQGDWRGKIVLPEGNPGRAVAFRFVPDGISAGPFNDLQLIVASDSTALSETLRAVLLVLLVTGTVGLVAGIALIRMGLNRGLAPLDTLAAQVHQLKVDEAGLRLQTTHLPQELCGIAEKLNNLLQRVEASIERERRFSSHAAHELRTPLAELKVMAELIGKWPDEATPERSREMVEVIHDLEELLEKLSLLARADAGAYPMRIEKIDLPAGISRAIDRVRARATARGLQFTTRIEAGEFETDPLLWETIAANILDNAVDYSPPNSIIELVASPRVFTVSNPAPDLEPTDLDFLFERFWRKSTAREGPNHSGLGLAIVRTAAGLLGATCEATLAKGVLKIAVRWSQTTPQARPPLSREGAAG